MYFSELTRSENRIIGCYLLIEAFLFALIQWAETTQPYEITGKIMYAAIVLNSIVIFCFYRKYRGDVRVPLAIMVTMVADYYLTYENHFFEAGVTWFILVQLVYAWKTRIDLPSVLFRLFWVLLYFVLLTFLGMDRIQSALCAISMGILTGNVVYSWINVKEGAARFTDPDFLLALGLTLFAGCDISLGLRNLMADQAGSVTGGMTPYVILYSVMYYLTWICYLPSQVLLVCSYLGSVPPEDAPPETTIPPEDAPPPV
ncbi:MAG: hypothetical protein IKX76_03425 [Eubacterium sp.]|nr:hypothetical protein [Eubacterium sp.]